ncbi:MAG: crossover junction endodeoxyribonuclease RuvC [bacterium]|nr:crossover junction endodeoxyribonuclease RuvC [bacterium]
MIICGIDPGTARIGWSIIKEQGSAIRAEAYGCIETSKTEEQSIRLLALHTAIDKILKEYHPSSMAVEDIFYATNAKTVISVGQARGVILFCAAQNNIPVISYSPPSIKRTICGDGRADKAQVQKMVMRILRLTAIPKPDDAADALAIALTHAYSYKLHNILNSK